MQRRVHFCWPAHIMTRAFYRDRTGAMNLDIAIFYADIAATSGHQDFVFGHYRNAFFAGGDFNVFIASDFNIVILSLQLDFAFGCDDLQRDFIFYPCHK